MKQIYNQLKPLNRFEKILVAITLLSFVALIMLVLDFQFIPNIFNLKPSVIENINNLINDLSIGIIASFIFYIIVQWFPEKEKEKSSIDLINVNLDNIIGSISSVINVYKKIYFPDSDIENLTKIDFDKIGFFSASKYTINDSLPKEMFLNYFSNDRSEVIFLDSFLSDIYLQIGYILKSPYVHFLPKDLIFSFYEFRDSNFYHRVNMIYNFNENQLNRIYTIEEINLKGYNIANDEDRYLSIKLHQLYKINLIFKKYSTTSSSSRQSS